MIINFFLAKNQGLGEVIVSGVKRSELEDGYQDAILCFS